MSALAPFWIQGEDFVRRDELGRGGYGVVYSGDLKVAAKVSLFRRFSNSAGASLLRITLSDCISVVFHLDFIVFVLFSPLHFVP